jgi:hypothetical protein
MEAKIVLLYENKKDAKAVLEAVSPDNIKTPNNLFLKTTRTGNSVETLIVYEGDNIRTLLSTIDDFLSCVLVVENTFSVFKKYE